MIQVHVLRFTSGQDVRKEITKYVLENEIDAGSIVSAVGSLNEANIRFADQKNGTELKGPFEVVSFSGTIGRSGNHIHLAISDGEGKTTGGHLMDGNIVHTTLELVLQSYPELVFKRVLDPTSGYKELVVERR